MILDGKVSSYGSSTDGSPDERPLETQSYMAIETVATENPVILDGKVSSYGSSTDGSPDERPLETQSYMAIETIATEIPWYLTEKSRATDRQPMALRRAIGWRSVARNFSVKPKSRDTWRKSLELRIVNRWLSGWTTAWNSKLHGYRNDCDRNPVILDGKVSSYGSSTDGSPDERQLETQCSMAIETIETEIPWYLTEKFRATDRQPMALRMNDRLKLKVPWL